MPRLANIGPRGVRTRALQGTVALVAAGALFVIQTLRGTPPAWTLACAPLLWLAGIGIFQARART